MDKRIVFIFSLLIVLVLIGNVLAITASIGNARMIIYADTGETVERSVLVKNINDAAVNIDVFASGDLADNINVKDKNFTLQPGEEKKAYFTIKAKEAGTTESKINIQFTPVDGKNGAGLSSTVILVAGGENVDDEEGGNSDDENADDSSTGITGNAINLNKNMIALGSTLILAIIFIIALIIYYYKFKKKSKEEKEGSITIKKTKLKKRVKKRA